MNWFRNINVGKRLAIAFTAVTVLLAMVSTMAVYFLHKSNVAMRDSVERRLLHVIDLENTKERVLTIGILVRDSALSENPEIVERNAQIIEKLRQDISGTLKAVGEALFASGSQEHKEMFESMTIARDQYGTQIDLILRQLNANEFDGARAGIVGTLPGKQAAYFAKLNETAKSAREAARGAANSTYREYHLAQRLLIATALLAAAIAGVLGLAITRSVTRPSRHALEAAQALADGNLVYKIPSKSQDELGRALGAMQHAFTQMGQVVRNVQGAARQIKSASHEIFIGNVDLSRRTAEQSASLEETRISMVDLTNKVRQNAENAKHANELAQKASAVASDGGRAVKDVVGTMEGISQSSGRISNIVGLIESIAFQTNILALNAAVEAARAGEQGKGFSVVAAEVRSLAQRSSSAAKEIGELIRGSVRQVDNGRRQVEMAGKTMDEMVCAVRQVTDIMGEISAASDDQRLNIEKIGSEIAKIEGTTRQNAALAEEASAAADSLMQQAESLVLVVSRFEVDQAEVVNMASPQAAVVPEVSRPSFVGKPLQLPRPAPTEGHTLKDECKSISASGAVRGSANRRQGRMAIDEGKKSTASHRIAKPTTATPVAKPTHTTRPRDRKTARVDAATLQSGGIPSVVFTKSDDTGDWETF